MDKQTLSNYGWVVIAVLVLAVMIALATPFGSYIKDAVKETTYGLYEVEQNAFEAAGIDLDDNLFSDDGFKYQGRKYEFFQDVENMRYFVVDADCNVTVYDANNNTIGQIPSVCVTCEALRATISNTGSFDGVFEFSRDGHSMYQIINGIKELVAIEEGYCQHIYTDSNNWVTVDNSDPSNPKVHCNKCGDMFGETVIKDGVIYTKNIAVRSLSNAGFDNYASGQIENLQGKYYACIFDTSAETIRIESKINGIDVARVTPIYDYNADYDIYASERFPNLKTVLVSCNTDTFEPFFHKECQFMKNVIEFYHIDGCDGSCGR